MLKTTTLVLTMVAVILGCNGSLWANEPAIALNGGVVATADTAAWTGSLVDANCRHETPTAQCTVGDETTAFGLVTSDGRFYPFDKAGNAKTRAALQKVARKTGEIKVSVTGTIEGETIKVKTIQIQ